MRNQELERRLADELADKRRRRRRKQGHNGRRCSFVWLGRRCELEAGHEGSHRGTLGSLEP